MADKSYLFIDGGYLRQRYSDAMKRVFGADGEIDFRQVHGWHVLRGWNGSLPERVFYYDSVRDAKTDNENERQFKERLQHQQSQFDEIQSLPGFHVRLGNLTGAGRKLRQKKVDVQLAVDMLDHSFRKNMAAAMLLAGDADFTPLVEAVTRLGTWVEVFYHPIGASKELYSAADKSYRLTFNDMWSFGVGKTRERYRLPNVEGPAAQQPEAYGEVIRTGTSASGRAVFLGIRPGESFLYVQGQMLLRHPDRQVLQNYFTEQFETIGWN